MTLDKAPSAAVVTACLLCAGASFAQQGEKRTCDVPLAMDAYDPSSRSMANVKGLGVNDLKVRLGTEWHDVVSVAIDDGPKRVVVILDDSARIPQEELRLETELAASFVRHGRRGDTFALLLVGSPNAPSPLEPAKKTVKRLSKVKPSRQTSTNSGTTYDALLAASNLLTPPRFGDLIYLFGRADDSGSTASPGQVRELLLTNGVRFCGLGLAFPLTSQMLQLSRWAGCVFSFTSLRDLAMGELQGPLGPLPSPLSAKKSMLADRFAELVAPYRIGIAAASIPEPMELTFDMPTAKERKIDVQDEYYPRYVYPCTPARP